MQAAFFLGVGWGFMPTQVQAASSKERVRAYRTHPCISESPYHSNKPPGRHPYTPEANNRCVAQGAVGQPIDTTGQLPDNTTECKAGL